MKLIKHIDTAWIETAMFILFFLFSLGLMWKTFRITPEENLEIAAKAWSDFSATIPLIRSFSRGNNFPPQYPLFAGPPIRYHFIFFLLVGIMEKIGIRLDFALNTLSSFAFFSLLILIYFVGKIVFKSRSVGLISVILFLFNGSFGFLEFFKKYPISVNTFQQIVQNTQFSSFGPYDGKIVSAFWSLNIYTNQRHLALAYSIFLLFLILIYKYSKNPDKFTTKKSVLLGIFLGIFPFIHFSAFIMTGISLLLFLFLYPKIRKSLFLLGVIALTIAIPQFLYIGKSQVETNLFHPGYIINNLDIQNFLKYWFMNLGITILLAPIGFLLSNKEQRKIAIPFISFFLIGNLFQFAPDMPTNHKFFNLFIIGANFFTAVFIIKLWKSNIAGKMTSIPLFLVLTLTGIIDLFPIINDRYITITDIPNNLAATFIAQNIPKDAVFLNAMFINDPASIAGRKIYLGWPYFSWGSGYDTSFRTKKINSMLTSNNIRITCMLLKNEGIDYIELQKPTTLEGVSINYDFIENNFQNIYSDPNINLYIYGVTPTCDRLAP